MKKIVGLALALMIVFSSMAYAEGDKVCGDDGQGYTGGDGDGTGLLYRAPSNDYEPPPPPDGSPAAS